ncbi:hypothetical protein HDV63DRAFT_376230 [Trichoderma sp. SZMC 28014]
MLEGNKDDDTMTEPPQPETSEQLRCLFGCGTFANRSSLTRYVKRVHDFKNSFFCPACKHLGLGEVGIESDPCAWSNHVERTHGKIHAPNIRSKTKKPAYCPLCENSFLVRGFI